MAFIGQTNAGANSTVSLSGAGTTSIISPHIPAGGLIRSGDFTQVGGTGRAQANGGWVEIQKGPYVYETSFSIYFGSSTVPETKRYWYWTRPTGVSTWMEYLKVSMWEGNWSYGQLVGYKDYHITSVANTWAVTLDTSINGANFTSAAMGVKVNGTTNVLIGGINTAGSNSIRYTITSATDNLFTHNMTLNFTDTNPFV